MSVQEKVVLADRSGNLEFKDIKPLFIGCQNCSIGHTFGPNIRTCYLVHFVGEGEGKYVKDGKEWNIKKGEAFIIKPNEVIRYSADLINPWSYAWIGFKGDFAKVLDNLQPVFKVSPLYYTEIKNLVKNATDLMPESVVSIVFRLFAEILENKSVSVDYVGAVKNYIETNYMNEITIEQIARAVNLDRRYLSRVFKDKTGIGLKQYLIDFRLNKSVEYMKKGYNVSQSASMCGYFDLFNFSKIFKKNYGISPKKFYNEILN